MLTVTVQVDAPSWAAQGVKEHLAMCLEGFGDTRVIRVDEGGPQRTAESMTTKGPEQTRIKES
jgi:hypothetical protein